MKTILVPLDFSPISRRVLAQAVVLARATEARLVLLHVVKPVGVVKDLAPLAGGILEFTDEVGGDARRKLQQIERRLAAGGVSVEALCQAGKPLDVIREMVRRFAPSFVVVGSHGHTAFYDLVVGSTTSGLLKSGECAVVVVPAQPSRPKPRAPRATASGRALGKASSAGGGAARDHPSRRKT